MGGGHAQCDPVGLNSFLGAPNAYWNSAGQRLCNHPGRFMAGKKGRECPSLSDQLAQTFLVLSPSKIRGHQHALKDGALGMDARGLGRCRPWRERFV